MPPYFAPVKAWSKWPQTSTSTRIGVVHDRAPSHGQEAALGHAGLVLDCGPELACRKRSIPIGAPWSSQFEYLQSAEVGKTKWQVRSNSFRVVLRYAKPRHLATSTVRLTWFTY